jgi:uncharacterized protein
MTFLTAEWRRLILATYDIDPSMLDEHLPPGCVADVREDRAFVSLVAFDFLNTRVLGIRWPGYVNFPEVNLRAYVRHADGRRGVTFISELVPQKLVARMARWTHNEPYEAIPMRSRFLESDASIEVDHIVTVAGKSRRIRCNAQKPLWTPAADSAEVFFKEHAWGFGTSRRGKLITYNVQHPHWQVYTNPQLKLESWSFAEVYGEKWKRLDEYEPCNVVLAEGSSVRVSGRV